MPYYYAGLISCIVRAEKAHIHLVQVQRLALYPDETYTADV